MEGFENSNYVNIGGTVGSTGTDITSCGEGDTNDVWFKYTPSYSDEVVISLCHESCTFDTTLAVFDSCGGEEIADACNDRPRHAP